MRYLFISDGRLFTNSGGENVEITSKFAQEKMEDTERERSAHGWKSDGSTGADPYFGSNIVWGGQARSRPFRKFRFKNVMVKSENTIYYLLTNDFVTGLFQYDISANEELRLFHKREFQEFGMDYSPSLDRFVAAITNEDQSVDIELLNNQGGYEKSLTSGDSRDSNPFFSKSEPEHILYQTAGIGRGEEGFIWGYGPEAVNKVDIHSGEIITLLADERYDFLLPRDDRQGNVYCIRRPYHAPGYTSPVRTLWYLITFPVRLVIAILRFLDAFTKLFNREPMRTAGPVVEPPIRDKYVRVLGQTIDMAKIQRGARFSKEPSLVPKSWELIKLDKQGRMSVVSKRVSSFDIDDDGKVHITNGFRVRKLVDDGAQTALKYNIIELLKVAKAT
jgi:hypothetical protein